MSSSMTGMTRRALLVCLLLAAVMTGGTLGKARAPEAHAAALPAGLPSHLGIGLSAPADTSGLYGWMPNSGIPWDYAYQYLAGGVNTGGGWETWNGGGQFPLSYAQGSASHNYVPVFPYYELLQSNGTCGGCPENQKDLSNLNNAGLMSAYYQNFALLMQRLGPGTYNGIAGFGKTAIVQVEPDFSGYAQQAVLNNGGCFGNCTGQGNNPAFLKASVRSSGYGAVSSYPDTYQGFNWALLHLRDLYAPNVLLAFHVSNWATGTDVGSNGSAGLDATGLGNQAGSFAAQSGITGVPAGTSSYDLLFNDVLDRDAAYYQYAYGDSSRWWDRLNVSFPNFTRWEAYIGAASRATGRSVIVWQIPEGNQYFDTVNNTNGHYQDNRAEYFFGHIGELQQAGIIGLLFGAGNGGSTVHTDGNGDGVTNPASFCTRDGLSSGQICNNHTSTVSDDDGGYIRQQAQAYYASLGSATATPTSTATASPTATPTTTSTPTPTSTPRSGTIATLGNTAVGSSTDTGDAGSINGSRFTMGSSGGTVTSMSVHVGAVDGAPNNQYQLAIYADSNGTPGLLVAQSGTGTLTANAWNTLPLSASLNADAAYWLVYNTNGTNQAVNDMQFGPASGGTQVWSNAGVPFGTWPGTFPPSTQGSGLFSVYATYTMGGAAATATPTASPTSTKTPGPTATATRTPTPAPSATSTRTPTATPSAAPSFGNATTVSPSTVARGGSAAISVKLTDAAGSLTDGIVDIEVYNSAGQKVGQTFSGGQSFGPNQSAMYTYAWTAPGTSGTYTVKLGVFGRNWYPLYYWDNGAATIGVQ